MLDDSSVFVGIEEIGCNPFGFTIIQRLLNVNKYVWPILDSAHNLNTAFWVSSDKWLEKFYKALDAIPDPGAVLGVAGTGVFCYCFSDLAISDAFQIEISGII